MTALLMSFFFVTADIESNLQHYNPQLSEDRAFILAINIAYAAQQYGIPPEILTAVVIKESHGKSGQYNRYGACGVCQVVWRIWGKELKKYGICSSKQQLIWDDHANIMAGAWILQKYKARFGEWDKTLLKYSGGAYGCRILNCLNWNINCRQ